MMLRRRCDILTTFCVTSVAIVIFLVTAILYGTRSETQSLPPLIKEVLPAGRCLCEYSTTFTCDTCLDCAANQINIIANATTDEDDHWVFSHRRDANNYGLDEEQCQAAFPGLYEDIDRAARYRKATYGKVSEQDLSSIKLSKGMVRAMIYDGELYILKTFLVDNVNRQKAVATLAGLHRAIVASHSRQSIPNIEFVFTVEDLPAEPEKPLWSLSRRAPDNDLWLIPDFGFWAWDMPQIGTLAELSAEATEREAIEPWDSKIEKLVWRGKVTMAPKLRRALIDAAKGKPWSDVGQVTWSNPDYKDHFLSPVDQCNYMFIAHAEGRSYSGSLKYRQLCRSVIVSHKLQWIQHYHYLFKASGPNQNYVEVERDFSDLEKAMNDLLDHPEKAKRIADNSVQVFRERYLTPAADACYWRTLIKSWKEVSFEPILFDGVEIGETTKKKNKRGVRYETFVLYEPEKQLNFPTSAENQRVQT